MQSFVFDTTHSILCEANASQRLHILCAELGMARVMIVTDPGLMAAGVIEPVRATLEQHQLNTVLYQDVQADPPEAVVLAAVDLARQHAVDGVIGIGGGSSMDVAKLIAVLTGSQQSIGDIYGIGNVAGTRLPLIQVPTTAGTGSEVTPIAIITTGETTKTGVIAKQLLPDYAVLDAQLTLGLPPQVTAATGIDAMVHAIEAYTSKQKKNPYSDMLAREALRLMSANLLEAVNNGANIEARGNMLFGSLLAGQAFANAPVAAVHALAYPLGGHFHIPHGLSNSLVLPHVLRFNASVCQELYAELLPCVVPNCDTSASSESRSALFIEVMERLIDASALPKTLREMKIEEDKLPMLAEDAMLQQRLLVNNPRNLEYEDALKIYQAAY